jgi:hypothetical protein
VTCKFQIGETVLIRTCAYLEHSRRIFVTIPRGIRIASQSALGQIFAKTRPTGHGTRTEEEGVTSKLVQRGSTAAEHTNHHEAVTLTNEDRFAQRQLAGNSRERSADRWSPHDQRSGLPTSVALAEIDLDQTSKAAPL